MKEPIVSEKASLDDRGRITIPLAMRKIIPKHAELELKFYAESKSEWRIVIEPKK